MGSFFVINMLFVFTHKKKKRSPRPASGFLAPELGAKEMLEKSYLCRWEWSTGSESNNVVQWVYYQLPGFGIF